MRKLIVFSILLYFTSSALAGGLQASFLGTPTNPCDVTCDSSSIGCWDGTTLSDGSLQDLSGCNLLVQSEDFGTTWTTTRASVSTDAIKNPVDGELTADAINEDSTAASTHLVSQGSVALVAGTTYTASVDVRPELRTWIAFFITGDSATQYCDVGNCATGNTSSAFSPTARRIDDEWCRCSMSWTAATTANRTLEIYIAEGNGDITFDGLNQTSLYLFGAQVREQRNVVHTNPGRYIATEAANKPWHDLAPNNAPVTIQGDFQRSDGNRITGRNLTNASTQYYSKADHDSLDIFDEDHTVTMSYVTKVGAPAVQGILTKGVFQTAGMYIFDNVGVDKIVARYNKAGALQDTEISITNVDDGLLRIIQVIRSSNVATLYKDGTAGTPMNVSTYGIDNANSLYLGSLNGGANPADAKIYYTHIQRRALSPDELASQREQLWGILSSKKTLGKTNIIVDGDMETAGVGSYTAMNDAILTKTTENVHQGVQALRVTYDGTSGPYARQNILTTGNTYFATGFARCDGSVAIPRVENGSAKVVWTGTTSSVWQPFDIVFNAQGAGFILRANTAAAGWCEFDDVYILEYDDSIWDFSRSTTAFQTYSDGTISEVGVNVPRVGGKGGGIEIEGQATNLEDNSDFGAGWTPVRSTLPSCASLSPELNNDIACILHEDATAANTHYITAPSGAWTATAGTDYNCSVYIKADNRDWVWIAMGGAGGAFNDSCYFNVSTGAVGVCLGTPDSYGIEAAGNGFYRVWVGEEAAATGAVSEIIYIAEADNDSTFDGLDQDSIHIYGFQCETGLFPTSYIPTSGGEVTRNADSMTIDPHVTNETEVILAETYCATCAAKELTVEFDTKCRFSDSSDIGSTRYLLDIGGNSGTASLTRNNLWVTIDSSGNINSYLRDDSDADHYMLSGADPVDFSEWHTYKVYFDLSDLSRMQMWIDGSVPVGISYGNNLGTAILDTTNILIRIGQNNSASVSSFCWFKNLRINNEEW